MLNLKWGAKRLDLQWIKLRLGWTSVVTEDGILHKPFLCNRSRKLNFANTSQQTPGWRRTQMAWHFPVKDLKEISVNENKDLFRNEKLNVCHYTKLEQMFKTKIVLVNPDNLLLSLKQNMPTFSFQTINEKLFHLNLIEVELLVERWRRWRTCDSCPRNWSPSRNSFYIWSCY